MFKSKKRKRADAIHKNFDEEFFFQGTDIIDLFSEEQKQILTRAMEKGYPAKAIAYPSVSPECMKAIMEFMYFHQADYTKNNISAVFLYKVAMLFKKPELCTYALIAKTYNVDIFEEFEDVRTLSELDLAFIAEASSYGENVCKKLNQGKTYEEIKDSISGRISFRRLFYKTSEFLYCFKYPGSEINRLRKLSKKQMKDEIINQREEKVDTK